MSARLRRTRGQVTVETAVMFGMVVAGLVAMALYLQRGVQGGVKSNSDSFGSQFSATKGWTVNTTSNTKEDSTSILQNQTTNYKQTM